jgi:hypothetical protein
MSFSPVARVGPEIFSRNDLGLHLSAWGLLGRYAPIPFPADKEKSCKCSFLPPGWCLSVSAVSGGASVRAEGARPSRASGRLSASWAWVIQETVHRTKKCTGFGVCALNRKPKTQEIATSATATQTKYPTACPDNRRLAKCSEGSHAHARVTYAPCGSFFAFFASTSIRSALEPSARRFLCLV